VDLNASVMGLAVYHAVRIARKMFAISKVVNVASLVNVKANAEELLNVAKIAINKFLNQSFALELYI